MHLLVGWGLGLHAKLPRVALALLLAVFGFTQRLPPLQRPGLFLRRLGGDWKRGHTNLFIPILASALLAGRPFGLLAGLRLVGGLLLMLLVLGLVRVLALLLVHWVVLVVVLWHRR